MATIANRSFSVLVTPTLPELIDPCGRAGTFLMYAAPMLAAVAFTARLMPQSKGRSMEEIEDTREIRTAPMAAAPETAR